MADLNSRAATTASIDLSANNCAHMSPETKPPLSPDHDDRIKDFLARHGGRAAGPDRHGESGGGARGWSEVGAADGYRLRCDWSRSGTNAEMQYTEISAADPP